MRGVAGRGRGFKRPAGIHSSLEHRPAGVAETALLPPQASGDGPYIRNLAGAKPVDVGCAGPLLFRGSGLGWSPASWGQGEKQAEGQSTLEQARQDAESGKSCLHDNVSFVRWRVRGAPS